MEAAVSPESVRQVVARYPEGQAALIPILQDVQAIYHWLPREALEQVAELLDLPVSHVYRVATFYRAFSLVPRGKHTLRVCMGTACHLKGSPRLVEAIGRELNIGPGETSSDGNFTLEVVNCLGACALAPVVVVDDKYFRQVNTGELRRILRQYGK